MFSVVFKAFLFVAAAVEPTIGTYTTCIHGGTKYKDGDYFPPNDTIIQTESPEQCVQCRCHQGLVVCEIENCPTLTCDEPTQYPQFCCQQCPDSQAITEKPSNLMFSESPTSIDNKDKLKPDCISNGRKYENGSVWQPIIGPFGVMACVQCRCHEGSVICNRLRCKDLPCSHPRREFGECCPVCPNSEIKENLEVYCLPESSEVFVFKLSNSKNDSGTVEYAFLDTDEEDDLVKIHVWNVSAKSSSDPLTVEAIHRKDFFKKNWKILGSTSRKRYKKYLKREKRLRGSCFIKCFDKIKRLENSLGIYAAVTRRKCADGEVNISDI